MAKKRTATATRTTTAKVVRLDGRRRHKTSSNVTKRGPVDPDDAPVDELERQRIRERWAADGFDDIDRKLLALIIDRPGMTDRELGAVVDLTRESVNRRKNRPIFKRAIEELVLDALTIFTRNQAKAARRLGELIGSSDLDVALRASIEHMKPILKRDGAGTGETETQADAFTRMLEEAYERVGKRREGKTENGSPTQGRATG